MQRLTTIRQNGLVQSAFFNRLNALAALALLPILTFVVGGCAPNAAQLKSAMESDPEILYAAMRKNPSRFVEVVGEVSNLARNEKEYGQLNEGFSQRKTPSLPATRAYDGQATAAITIVEYSDFQCGYCAQGHQTIKEIRQEYGDKVRVLLKHMPRERHPYALNMARLFEAIAQKDPDKAKRFQSILFQQQTGFAPSATERQSKTVEEATAKYHRRVEADLKKVIQTLGFRYEEIKKVADSEAIKQLIEEDQAEGNSFGFTGTPSYLINGVPVRGAQPLASFKYVIDRELQSKK